MPGPLIVLDDPYELNGDDDAVELPASGDPGWEQSTNHSSSLVGDSIAANAMAPDRQEGDQDSANLPKDVVDHFRLAIQEALDTHPTPVSKDLVAEVAYLLVQGGANGPEDFKGVSMEEALVVWQGLQQLPPLACAH